jgi:heterodisulfide reductase subunit A-like polyferredoxin
MYDYEKKGRYIVEFEDIPTERQHQIEIEVDERRGNYSEVELGFDEERALKEAKRCLSCRRCLGCALCWAECKPEAIIFEMEDEFYDIEADGVIISSGVERPYERIDSSLGLGQYFNVITDQQLTRMLSPAGPSKGLIIRPYDGEVPASIAFVQSYESASSEMHAAALCLGINEAILARSKLGQAEIELFASNLEAFLKEHGAALKKLKKIAINDAKITSVEVEEDQGLKLTIVSNGSETSKVFDLVVLITQPQLSNEVKKMSRSLDLSLNYANFLADGEGSVLLTTDKETIQLASKA